MCTDVELCDKIDTLIVLQTDANTLLTDTQALINTADIHLQNMIGFLIFFSLWLMFWSIYRLLRPLIW